MNAPSNAKIIPIWLDPDSEELLSYSEIASELGITEKTFKQRLRNYGADHCLTYFYGLIPGRCRRNGYSAKNCGKQNFSKLSTIKIEGRLGGVTPRLAFDFLAKLISFSQRDYLRFKCKESRSFLLNENGMLEWYIECIPKIDTQKFLSELRLWVIENS